MPASPATVPDDARFRLAMASAGIGMAIVSLDGQWVDVNPALCRMFGYGAEELVGRRVHALSHPDDLPLTRSLFERLNGGEADALNAEKRYIRKDGAVIEVLFTTALMRGADGAPLYFISQFRDVTAQRAAERALREMNDTLESRVRERTAELEAARRRIESFAYGVSHDLRAPLRGIDGFAAQLERLAGDTLAPQGREYLARIRGASARMGGLIDSLLELVRIGRAELHPVQVDVSLLAEWAFAELQDAQPQRAARIRVQPGLELRGDERLLKVLLTQLLRNAWQFSSTRAQVEVDVAGQRTAHGLRVTVRDHGIGFDMAHAGKLFEPFQRLHGSEQGAGNGIGLTIAQQVVARHGGSLHAEAVPGAGASFHVELRDLDAAAGAIGDAAEAA